MCLGVRMCACLSLGKVQSFCILSWLWISHQDGIVLTTVCIVTQFWVPMESLLPLSFLQSGSWYNPTYQWSCWVSEVCAQNAQGKGL